MTNQELNNKRTEDALECLDAVLSAVVISKKWASTKYPNPYINQVEEQSFIELFTHLNKAETVLRNYISTFNISMEGKTNDTDNSSG